jgi:methionyl-tRNA formyltransferase
VDIVFCGYRDWSKQIQSKIEINSTLVTTPDELTTLLKTQEPDIIFFIGWSWIVDKDTVDKYMCICLHPSPLPKYRGGSPIQHQIINGEDYSAVTLFKMNDRIDQGEIYYQKSFSLSGDLDEVFNRIVDIGVDSINYIVRHIGDIQPLPQEERHATYFSRRKPTMSEIRVEDFVKYTAKELYNKIRSLQDPYPNAYVICKGGTKLYINGAKLE